MFSPLWTSFSSFRCLNQTSLNQAHFFANRFFKCPRLESYLVVGTQASLLLLLKINLNQNHSQHTFALPLLRPIAFSLAAWGQCIIRNSAILALLQFLYDLDSIFSWVLKNSAFRCFSTNLGFAHPIIMKAFLPF